MVVHKFRTVCHKSVIRKSLWILLDICLAVHKKNYYTIFLIPCVLAIY